MEKVIAEADRFLYIAKTSGRGCLVSETDLAGKPQQTILLVDSDASAARAITDSLEREGFEVLACLEGATALKLAQVNSVSLIILNLRLAAYHPVLITDIRRTPQGKTVPVLMTTTLGTEAEVEKGFSLGADDYLVKPFTPHELMMRVHNLLRK